MKPSRFRIAPPATVRAIIAQLLDRDSDAGSASIGSITLKPHQVSAVQRLREAVDEFGGALLCDPVGTGKTYVALALGSVNETILVVGPAALREMWMSAASASERRLTFVSFESLSRGSAPRMDATLLIVDETHHARNPATRRYEMLSRLASQSKVLLLSATPIHNRREDLVAVLALFLGDRARNLTSAELARCIVRREKMLCAVAGIPKTEPLVWLGLPEDDTVPRMLLDLPPPLPTRDGGDGGALVAHSLVRQWASSEAALTGALERRLQRATALISALEDGTWPTRQELLTWLGAESSVQYSFARLLSQTVPETDTLLPVIRVHRDAVAGVLHYLRSHSGADAQRAAIIRTLRAHHNDRKIVAFSQYADTIDGLFRLLVRDGQVAALSGSGAHVASGSISRRDAIERFAPVASGHSTPRAAEDVSLLLTTDILSEGVNLQDAGVVIHLDLPWTPARIEQRVGRVTRIGSRYSTVFAYAIRPPASADAIVSIARILEEKIAAAGIVADNFSWLNPSGRAPEKITNEPALAEERRTAIAQWRDDSLMTSDGITVVAAVRAKSRGFLAACIGRGSTRLIGCVGDRIADDSAMVLECLGCCAGSGMQVPLRVFEDELRRLSSWLYAGSAIECIRLSPPGPGHGARSAILRRITAASHRSRLHDRPRIAALARDARVAALATYGAFAEDELRRLALLEMCDEDWLEGLKNFGALHQRCCKAAGAGESRIAALVVFRSTAEAESF